MFRPSWTVESRFGRKSEEERSRCVVHRPDDNSILMRKTVIRALSRVEGAQTTCAFDFAEQR